MQTVKKKSIGFKIGIALAALHLVLVILAFIAYITSSSSTSALVFIWFFFLDAPIRLLPSAIFDIFGVAAPLISFGVFGSALWFLIPWLLDRLAAKIFPKAGRKIRWVVIIGAIPLILIGFTALGDFSVKKSIQAERPTELKKMLDSASSDFLTEKIILENNDYGAVSSIRLMNCRPEVGLEIMITLPWGVAFLNNEYQEQHRIKFSQNRSMTIEPVGRDGNGSCTYMAYKLFEGVYLYDSEGNERWNITRQDPNGSAGFTGIQSPGVRVFFDPRKIADKKDLVAVISPKRVSAGQAANSRSGSGIQEAHMKPRIKIATARTPDGGEMVLYQHGRDFSIMINGQDLMHSRQHESELALARLGCAHLADHKVPRILIGGLGMGYTLRQALDMLSPRARVVVGELLGAVVEWNQEFLGKLNGQPLGDSRVDLKTGDVFELISGSRNNFDAILLDIDNGPEAMTDTGNRRLYGREGIQACRRALRQQGCLAVWSAEPSKKFEQLLMSCGFHVRRFRSSAYKGSKSQSRFVWVAAETRGILPPGGGEPRRPPKNKSKENRRRPRERRNPRRY